jgi:hypothetical protein
MPERAFVHRGRQGDRRARRHAGRHSQEHARRGELISIGEAALLSIVTIVAAWSGYSAAKWSTHSSLNLGKATATRAEANRAYQQALTLRTQDAADFNAWFAAYLRGDKQDERVAERRFRPQHDVAFRAWVATKPFISPNAPRGPQYMPQYRPTGEPRSRRLDRAAGAYYTAGQSAAGTGDKYIRVTVVLASVLFIVGISSHFPLRTVRYGLVALGAGLLLFAAIEILSLPGPPA